MYVTNTASTDGIDIFLMSNPTPIRMFLFAEGVRE